MAKFDIDRVVWSKDGKDIPEGTFVLYSDSIDTLKKYVENNEWTRAGVVVYTEKACGKTDIIDLFSYLGDIKSRQFAYAIDKNLDKDVDKYIERSIDEIKKEIKLSNGCMEEYKKAGILEFAKRALALKEHCIEVLEKALAA